MWPSLIEEKSFAQSWRKTGVRLIAKLGICTQNRTNIETEGFFVDLEGIRNSIEKVEICTQGSLSAMT